jgi:hypothetical protein
MDGRQKGVNGEILPRQKAFRHHRRGLRKDEQSGSPEEPLIGKA